MVGNTLRYTVDMLKANMKAAATLRGAYITRSIFNITNHSIYLSLWVLIFDAIPSIGGWRVEHILLAYGLGIFAWGFLSFAALGLRTLPRQIDDGELDTYLTQPKPVLLNVALGTTQTVGPPEMIFGGVVLTIAGIMTAVSILMLLLMTICTTIVFTSLVLAYGSLGFWLKGFHGNAEEIYFNFFIIATRPEAIFHGWMLVMIFTFMPVAFMAHVPLHVLLDNNMNALLLLLSATTLIALISYRIFKLGLSRYESGNRFGVRG